MVGGDGFRQQVVEDESADWPCLNQSLYAVTFVTQGEQDRGKSCVLCLESDHTEEQCALYSPVAKTSGSIRQSGVDRSSMDLWESSPLVMEKGWPHGMLHLEPGRLSIRNMQVSPHLCSVLGQPPHLLLPLVAK